MPRRAWKIARLARPAKHRKAMLRTMTTQLIKYERIQTTYPKAKALSVYADRMVGLAKRGEDRHRVMVTSFVREREMVWKLFDILAPRYEFRTGGYTRVVKTPHRLRDAAPMAYIEFVDRPGELRPASPVNEEKYNEFVEKSRKAAVVKEAFEQKNLEYVRSNWKVKTIPNPFPVERGNTPPRYK